MLDSLDNDYIQDNELKDEINHKHLKIDGKNHKKSDKQIKSLNNNYIDKAINILKLLKGEINQNKNHYNQQDNNIHYNKPVNTDSTNSLLFF